MSLPVANTRNVMSEWPNRCMLQLPEPIDGGGVDTACGCNCHCLCPWFLAVARILSGFVMIAWASGLGMVVGRFSRPLRGVGVLAVPDAWQDSTWRIESDCEVHPVAGVLRLLVLGVVVGVCIECRCGADRVEVTLWAVTAMPEFFSKDEGVEFWPWIVEATEFPTGEVSLLPAGAGKASLSRGNLRIPQRSTLVLCLDNSYNRSHVRVTAVGRHSPI